MNFILFAIKLVLNNNLFLGLYHKFRGKFLKKIFVDAKLLKFKHTLTIDKKTLTIFLSDVKNKNRLIKISKDFVNGKVHIFQKVIYYKDYKISEYTNFSKKSPINDIRFVWEIYRNKVFFNLGLVYQFTKDEKIANEVFDYIISFEDYCPILNKSNKIPYCAMEASIRLYNLYWISYYFSDSENYKKIDYKLKNIFQHYLNYIWTNYEIPFYGLESNHSISDAFGLILGATVLPKHPMSKKWFNFGKKIILRSTKKQFFNDGINFESSIHYHRFVFEMLMLSFLIFKNNKTKLPDSFINSLKKIGLSLIKLSHSNYMIPRFGDNDGGKLFYDFESRENFLSMKYLLWFRGSSEPFPETLIFPSISSYKTFLNPIKTYSIKNYIVIKTQDFSLVAPSVSIGTNGKGNHQHNDFLSFELYSNYPFIVDPWSFCYSGNAEYRNKDRSVHKHNTICLDNREIVPFKSDRLFEMLGSIKVKQKFHEHNSSISKVTISHNRYKNLKKGKQFHQREFVVNKDSKEVQIKDKLSGKGNHDGEIKFFIPKKHWNFFKETGKYIFTNNTETFTLTSNVDILELHDDFISPNFLSKEDSFVLIGKFKYFKNIEIITKINYKKNNL